MSLKNLPVYERPREKLLARGADNCKDEELIAILLRTGIKGKTAIDLAKLILKQYPLDKLLDCNQSTLQSIKGIDITKIATLLAAFEIAKRALKTYTHSLPMIQSPQDAVDQVTSYRSKTKEHFIVLYLNARNQVIHQEIISVGTINSSLVHPREVYEPAVKYLASAIVLVHNHPSGELTPSEEDIGITQRLNAAGNILGIDILDHLIITRDDFLSFKEGGIL